MKTSIVFSRWRNLCKCEHIRVHFNSIQMINYMQRKYEDIVCMCTVCTYVANTLKFTSQSRSCTYSLNCTSNCIDERWIWMLIGIIWVELKGIGVSWIIQKQRNVRQRSAIKVFNNNKKQFFPKIRNTKENLNWKRFFSLEFMFFSNLRIPGMYCINTSLLSILISRRKAQSVMFSWIQND